MKRILALILSVAMLAAFATGCKKNNTSEKAEETKTEAKEDTKYVEGGMKIATTTSDFGEYTRDLKQRIDYLSQSGFRYIDLSFFGTSDMDPFMKDSWKDYASELKQYAADKDMTFVQAHAPNGTPFKDQRSYDDAVKKIIRSIEVCQVLGIQNIVVHPGDNKEFDQETYTAKNLEFFSEFIPTMEATGVNVLIENSSKELRNCYCMDTGEELKAFIELLNHPQFKVCWDTGHANLQGAQYDHIVALGDLLAGIHISDNLGEDDNHMMPYQGVVNFDEVMSALVKIDYKGVFTFECDSNLIYGKSWLNSRNEYTDSLKLYYPPVEVKISMEKTMLQIGEYMPTQYEIPLG